MMNSCTFLRRLAALSIHPKVFSKLSGISMDTINGEVGVGVMSTKLESTLVSLEKLDRGL